MGQRMLEGGGFGGSEPAVSSGVLEDCVPGASQGLCREEGPPWRRSFGRMAHEWELSQSKLLVSRSGLRTPSLEALS